MKENIHPNYGKAVVRCVCGETFETGSVKKEMRVDICSKCHPFYTGKQKLVDTGGRVDRFKKRFGRAIPCRCFCRICAQPHRQKDRRETRRSFCKLGIRDEELSLKSWRIS